MARLKALLLGTLLAAVLGWGVLTIILLVTTGPVQYYEVELHVTDVRGDPIETFGWQAHDEPDWKHPGWNCPVTHQANGTTFASFPEGDNSLWVDAPGHAHARIPSIHVDEDLHRIDVVMQDLGLVRGVVTYLGRPVTNASVELVSEEPEASPNVPSGLVYGYHDEPVHTDDAGAFQIGSDFPEMPFHVRVCKDGLASRIAGTVKVGDPPLLVEMSSGGAIDGRVCASGVKAALPHSIRLYKEGSGLTGSCEEQTTATDADGRFRFEHVGAGAWLLRMFVPGDELIAADRLPLDELPFRVEVREDQTLLAELDLARDVAVVTGDMKLNGRPWKDAYVSLYAIGDRSLRLDAATADASGHWVLRVRAPGTYRLVVRGNHQHAVEPRSVSDVVEITAQGSAWRHEFTWTRAQPDELVLAGEPAIKAR